MRHFKYLIMVFAVVFLFGCSIGTSSNPDLTIAENSIIYANDISFQLDELNVKVGDKIKLSDLKVNVSPSNAKVTPTIDINTTNKVDLNNNEVTFISAGEVEFVAKVLSGLNTYKTATLKCKISETDVYATNINFTSTEVVVDLSETTINNMQIMPVNYNGEIEVSYANNNIVATYDYKTGLVTPIKEGSGTITVKVRTSEVNVLVSSFNVTVTNNIYANKITNVKANNVMLGEEIVLFVGDKGNLSYVVEPAGFNMSSFVSTSNNLIAINELGKFVVGNTTGECEIIINAQTKNGFLTKTIKVNVVKEPEQIDFEVKYNNETVTEFYTNTYYNVEITTPLKNYSNIIFENCQYEYVNDNVYKIMFASAGNVTINANTTMFGTISSKIINGTKNFRVYNAVTDVNFSLMNNNKEIIPSNGIYTIYLPNKDKISEAVEQNELVYADVYLGAKGLYITPNVLSYTIEGKSIILSGNRIIANTLGTSKIIVSSSDINGFTKEYIIEVKPLEIREILVDNSELNLYLNGNENFQSSVTIAPSVLPECAYNTNIEIITSSTNISLNNYTISALYGGNASITLKSGNITKVVNITISYVPTHLLVKLNNNEIKNGDVYTCEVGDINSFVTNVYSNEVLLANKNAQVTINSQLVTNETLSKLCFEESGNYQVVVYYGDLSIEFIINVKLTNKITKFEFEEDSWLVNLYFVNQLTLNYCVELQYPNKPVSDLLTFASLNTQVATLNNETINIVGVGTTSIVAYINGEKVDEYVLNVYDKEVLEINSLNDFYNIEDGKSYIVNSNLDFSGFSVGSGKNFDGEIDFNNKEITNLKTPLFNTLGENAKIINVKISGNITLDSKNFVGDIDESFGFIATKNNGIISNVSFDNLALTINNSQEKLTLIANLIAFDNNGTITNVNYNNVSVAVSDNNASSVNGYIITAGVYNNYGTICNVTGNIEFSGFTKIGGLVVNHYNLIKDVNLNLTYNCTQSNKIQIGGLVHKSFNNTATKPTFNNIILNIKTNNLSDCTDLKFGGLIFTNQISEGDNITVNHTFVGIFNSTKTYLLFYANTLNNLTNVEVQTNKEFDY